MQRSKVAPPGARFPLLIFAVALVAGAMLFFGVHRAREAAPRASQIVAQPAATTAGVQATP